MNEENLQALAMALDNSQSLLVAMLHERRPYEEIETQIAENRAALDAAGAGEGKMNEEKLKAVLIEIMLDYERCEAISSETWQKACDLLGIAYDLGPLK